MTTDRQDRLGAKYFLLTLVNIQHYILYYNLQSKCLIFMISWLYKTSALSWILFSGTEWDHLNKKYGCLLRNWLGRFQLPNSAPHTPQMNNGKKARKACVRWQFMVLISIPLMPNVSLHRMWSQLHSLGKVFSWRDLLPCYLKPTTFHGMSATKHATVKCYCSCGMFNRLRN